LRQRGGLRGRLLAGRADWRVMAGLAMALVVVGWLLLRDVGPRASSWGGVVLARLGIAPETLLAADERASAPQASPRVAVPADDPCGPGAAPDMPETALVKASRRLRDDVVNALAASPDVSDQATAALLSITPFMDDLPTSACTDNPACLQKWTDKQMSRERVNTDAVVQRLAALADRSRSPYVYEMATLGCRELVKGSVAATEACNNLSLERWASLDPHNAVPWLALVERAQQRDDKAAVDNALYQAATATKSGGVASELMRRVLAQVPTNDTHRDLQADMAARAFGVAVLDMMGSGHMTAMGLCRDEHMADSNRRQTCHLLGARLLADSDTLLQSRLALALVKRTGLGSSEFTTKVDELDALDWAVRQRSGELEHPSDGQGCRATMAAVRYFGEMAQSSELGVARRTLDDHLRRSGQTVADVARQSRQSRDKAAAP
jgi:hypothetical protein